MFKVKLLTCCLLSICGMILCATPTITNVTPKQQQQQQRQRARAGFVDDDASDVIHIIEPPQHFQQLKMIVNQMEAAAPKPKPTIFHRKVTNFQRHHIKLTTESVEKLPKLRVKPTIQATTTTTTLPTTTTTTIKSNKNYDNRQTIAGKAKVKRVRPPGPEQQRRQQQQRKQVSKGNDLDLLTQAAHNMPQIYAPTMNLPVEILASVRKTERLMHKQRPQLLAGQHQMAPKPNQRLSTRRTHTVLMQKAYEHEKHVRGQAQQLAAEKVNFQQQNLHKSRAKRQVVTTSGNIKPNITEALKVVRHINELLQNATLYLPDNNSNNNNNNTKNNNSTKLARALGEKLFEANAAKALVGEIEPETQAALTDDNKLYKFLESSVNLTDSILNELLQRQQFKNEQQKFNSKKLLRCKRNLYELPIQLSLRMRNLQDKMSCLQQINQPQYLTPRQQHNNKRHSHVPNTNTLVYNDVMTNIRNMLLGSNHIKPTTIATTTTRATRALSYAAPLAPLAPLATVGTLAQGKADHSLQFNDFNDLNQYINRLGEVVEQIPYVHKFNYNNNNNNNYNYNNNEQKQQQFSTKSSKNDNWFHINSEGKVQQQHLDELKDDFTPYGTVFYRFPDMPGAEIFDTTGLTL